MFLALVVFKDKTEVTGRDLGLEGLILGGIIVYDTVVLRE